MYGEVRSRELPVYGAKTLAVRHGTLELHGTYINFINLKFLQVSVILVTMTESVQSVKCPNKYQQPQYQYDLQFVKQLMLGTCCL